ncbi:MAG: hypothetical protein AUJ98_06815 [Bacteroidetes bacterium CG2_30_33_31]|nr:MAG: hypothetical protein AUJ98_06815 [Bacteroidetes bacterium CG2_30_33_31]
MKNISILFLSIFIILTFSFCHNNLSSGKNDKDLSPIELLTKQIAEDPKNPELYIKRAELYKSKNDLNNAILDAQKAVQLDNKNYSYYLVLADLFLAANQIQGTISTLNAVLSDEPNNVEANLKMAELNLIFKRYSHVLENANTVLNVDPFNAKAFFIKGYSFMEQGDTTTAVKNYQESIKNDPEFYKAHVQLGILYKIKHNPIAVTYFQNAINIEPKNIDAYYNLGLFYQENDKLNLAQETYRMINEIDPKYPYSYFNTGFILLEISKTPDEAAKYFALAIKNKPDYYEAHFNLGLCFEELGNLEKAKMSYENALKYQNNYQKAIEGLNRIDEIMLR